MSPTRRCPTCKQEYRGKATIILDPIDSRPELPTGGSLDPEPTRTEHLLDPTIVVAGEVWVPDVDLDPLDE